jgi:hypothetical protein
VRGSTVMVRPRHCERSVAISFNQNICTL